jgi:hypothetical protein
MRRTDTMLKFGFKALRLHARGSRVPLLLITSHLPKGGSKSAYFLSELREVLLDAVATVGDFAGKRRLNAYFNSALPLDEQIKAPWRGAEQLPFDLDLFGEDSPWEDEDA